MRNPFNGKNEIFNALAFFIASFSLLFIIFIRVPLSGSLFGNIDIWFYVWQMNDYFNHTFGQAPFGQILYPSDKLINIMESPVGIGLIYSFFKLFISSDIWVFYLLSCTVLSLNGFSFYLFSRSLNIGKWVALLVAFMFAANNFSISNVENFNAFVLFPGILSAYAFRKAITDSNNKAGIYMVVSALLAGFQLYFSLYFFVFQFVIIGFTGLYSIKKLPKFKWFLVWAIILVLLMIPFVLQHQGLPEYLDKYGLMASAGKFNETHSISLFKDYLRADPGNLIYPAMNDIPNPWRYAARSAFFGFSTYIASLVAVIYLWRKKQKKLLFFALGIILVAIAISTGPLLKTKWYEIKTPVGHINTMFPDTNSFRHFFRAHLVTIAGSLLLIAFMFDSLIKHKVKGAKVYFVLFSIFFCVENIPANAELFNSSKYIEPPSMLLEVLETVPAETNLFFLPNCHIILEEHQFANNINQVNREFMYATWKNYIPYNIFNGRLSYVTDEAYENSRYTCNLNSFNLSILLSKNDINYFVVVNEFLSESEKSTLLPMLNRQTKIVSSNNEFAVYEVIDK